MAKKEKNKITVQDVLWACLGAFATFVMVYITVISFMPSGLELAYCPDIYPPSDNCYERYESYYWTTQYISLIIGGIAGIAMFLLSMFKKNRAVKWFSLVVIILFTAVVIYSVVIPSLIPIQ